MEQLPKKEKFEIDVFAAAMASFVVVAALAVIFTFPGWNGPIRKLNVRAASAVTVTHGQINSSFPGVPIPASSPAIAILKISVTASQASQTLTSATVNFSGAGFTTADLLAIATDATSGVALYTDHASSGVAGTYDDGVDPVVTLAASPNWTPSTTNITLTPATPVALTNAVAKIFYVVIKTAAGISNNDEIRAVIPANGVVTSDGNGPAVEAPSPMNFLRADTAVVAITSVSGYAGASTLTVRFNKPVQKVGGGNLTYVGAGDPFTYADGGGTAQTITAIAHNAGQDFATLTMSGNLDAEDADGTPATVAAGSNKIADFGGTAVGTGVVAVSSSLTITTPTIPTATVATVYSNASPLVSFVAQGGVTPYTFAANAAPDTTTLTNAGLAIVNDGGTYKITGTVLNIPGSYPLNIRVTDSTGGTPLTATRSFMLNIMTSGGGVPGIMNVSPGGGPQGATNMGVTITGSNTLFSGSSTVQFLSSGSNDTNLTVSSLASSGPTNLTFNLSIAGGASAGNRDVRVTTGAQIVTMPNGFNVFAAGAAGLNLLMPGENATNVPLPPGLGFSPSANAGVNSYRVIVKSTSNFSGNALWDYTFPKPADVQNTNGSHCDVTTCNLMYGQGTFRIITQATPLAPNTTYYWQVKTYSETVANVSDVATALEQTPVRGFTTVSSIMDVTPPMVMHRPVFQATASANLDLYARVNDNMATTTTTPALTTKIFYCAGAACDPTTEGAAPTAMGNGYFRYRIPSATISTAGTIVRYYLQASDGTNTTNFRQPDNITPFQLTSAASGASTIAGSVQDGAGTCSAGVQLAVVFAEGTGFSTATDASCAYTLTGLTAGTYDIVAVKEGYSDRMINGIPAGSTNINFQLGQGFFGGFGGDTTRARVRFTGPMDGMMNMPGSDSNFKIFVVFDKALSQSTVTATNLTINEVNISTGALTDVTSTKGSWTYYSTAPAGGSMLPPEANMAVWSLSGSNTLGDNKTIAVKVSANVTDTAGNPIQGNQPDGSFAFTFTTGSTANFSGFNSSTGTFSGGETFGSGQFVPPHVIGTTPPPGAIDVPRNAKIVINFSEPMADDGGGYLLKDNVQLFTVSGTTEANVSSTAISTVALDTTKRTATVTLSNSYNSGLFAASTSYRLKVLGGAKAATMITLGPPTMTASSMFQADFKTSASSDTAPPTIAGSYPDNAATNVPVNVGAVSVGFSKDMNSSTISASTFYLSIGSTAVNGTVEYDPVARQAMFMPQSALTPNTTYTVNLTASIQGLNGVAIAAATRTFTTGAADSAAPNIAFVNADDYNLAISFSEPMNSAKVTDTINYAASVVKPGNYTIKYATPPADSASGTTITIPTSASFNYDAATNTVNVSGYHDSSVTGLIGKEIYVSVANVKDLSGNTISGGTTGKAPIMNSATTNGALGPGSYSGDMFAMEGGFVPTNFSSTTFGFAPPIEVRPFNAMAGQTTIYGVRIPISAQIPASGAVVLTFPTGFDVTSARQDVNSPMRTDLNGPGTGAITFKCATAGAPTGASCAGTANSDDTGTAQGGLAGDGVVVNTSSRSVTVYLSAATNTEGHDFLTIDIAGIKNSTVPKDFNTTGYTVDVKTKNGATTLESMTSMPFFIQGISGEAYTLTGTITATGATTGTMSVYLMSPMTGPMDTTSTTFSGGSATYTFTNLQAGDYMLFTDQMITLNNGLVATEYTGKTMPERIVINETADTANSGANDNSIPYNFTIANASASGTAVTVSVNGPALEPLDIFAGSPSGFKAKQVTLDANAAAAENFTIYLTDGSWFVGVGPQMPKGMMAGPPPTPSYLPPKPLDVRVSGATVTENSGTANDGTIAFTLTSTSKSIRGVVKDGANKVMASAEVYAYSPDGGFGTHAQADSAGAFTLGVADGSYVVGSFVPGMPPSKEVPVVVTSDATTYLLIDGATTAITPAAAATSFILKVAKPDYTISGKVTDGTNVVQGANVYAYRNDGPGYANANTDSSGNYTLYVSNGTWKVGTFLPQYGNLAELTVTINGANATNQNFSPTATGTFRTVSGTVTSGGVAVQGAFVRLSGNGMFNETITGADGIYSFKVPVGSGYVIRAFIPNVGESAPLAAFDVAGSDVTGKDITVTTPRTVTITFSTSVTKAFIDLFSSNGVGNHVEINNTTTGTLSVPNGSYNIRVGMPGTAIGLTDIAGTGGTVYSSTTGVVTVDSNEALTVTVPTLRAITGTVTDGTNNLADAWVEVVNGTSGVHFGTKTATNGSFTLNMADGTYKVNAMKPGFFREPSNLVVNATTAAQTLTVSAASTTITGQVLIGSTGAANAFIRAEKQGGGFAGAQADATGNYTLYVNSGVWRVMSMADGYAEAAYAQNPIDVTGGSVSGKNITLTTAVSLAAPKTKPITPASGGTLEDTTAGVKLTIPANAMGTSTSAGNVQAKETNNVRETSSAKPLKSFDSSTSTYVNMAKEIKATDSSGNPITTLNDSITVEMTYSLAELAATASGTDSSINTQAEANTLKMAYWDETTSNWVTKPTTITYKDSSSNVITDMTTIDTGAEFAATVSTVTIAAATDHFSLYAPVVSADGAPTSAPSGLAKTSGTTTTITMGWTQVSAATGYTIYRSASSGGTFTRVTSDDPTVSSGSTVTYTNTGLSAGTTYYYKITAWNSAGESLASSEVSMATSAASGGASSGGGTYTPAPTTQQTPTATEQPTTKTETKTPIASEPVAAPVEASPITQIISESTKIATANADAVAQAIGKSRDLGLEQRYESTIVARIVVANTPAATKAKVVNFVTYGTSTTQALGAGERGGVVNSFRAAYGKVPASEVDWQDVIKIANGRWPSTLNATREKSVSVTFKKIYLRNPDRSNARDDAAVTVMAYGLRSAVRNLDSEKAAIKSYKIIFRKAPREAADWDAVRAIAYSGAKR